MKLSVIIPTYRRREFLTQALGELISQLKSGDEIIVIDNFGHDGVEKLVESFSNKQVKYYFIAERGPSFARNLGFRKSANSGIAFLDDDCLPEKNWLSKIRNILKEHQQDRIVFQGKINN